MKKLLFLSTMLCFQSFFAQVTIEKNKLVKNGETYKMSQYESVFTNSEAKKLFKKARTNSTIGSIFAFTGGALMGVSIPQFFRKPEKVLTMYTPVGPVYEERGGPNGWDYLIPGVVLVGVGIPFALAANKNAKKAIAIENGESTAFQPYFKLESTGTGLALSYNF